MQIEDQEQQSGTLKLQPVGTVGTEDAVSLLEEIRKSGGGVELDFSAVESLDVPVLQLMLVAVAGLRARGREIFVKDSESQVLRSTLELAGMNPEQAGLSARFVL